MRVALIHLDLLLEIFFGLHRIILEELFLEGKSGVSLSRSLAYMLLNYVITLTLSLVLRDGDVLMELVLLAFDHLIDSATHFLDKENVKLRVKSVLVVLVQAFN